MSRGRASGPTDGESAPQCAAADAGPTIGAGAVVREASDGAAAEPDPAADVTINVSDLAPPEPMVRILEACAQLAPGRTLWVEHARRPIYLYPRLDEHGYAHETRELGPGRVELRIRRLKARGDHRQPVPSCHGTPATSVISASDAAFRKGRAAQTPACTTAVRCRKGRTARLLAVLPPAAAERRLCASAKKPGDARPGARGADAVCRPRGYRTSSSWLDALFRECQWRGVRRQGGVHARRSTMGRTRERRRRSGPALLKGEVPMASIAPTITGAPPPPLDQHIRDLAVRLQGLHAATIADAATLAQLRDEAEAAGVRYIHAWDAWERAATATGEARCETASAVVLLEAVAAMRLADLAYVEAQRQRTARLATLIEVRNELIRRRVLARHLELAATT